jgi:hypothetical protein
MNDMPDIPKKSKVDSLQFDLDNRKVIHRGACESCMDKSRLRNEIYEMRLKIKKCKSDGNCPPCTFCPRDQVERYERFHDIEKEKYPGCNTCFDPDFAEYGCNDFCWDVGRLNYEYLHFRSDLSKVIWRKC